MPSLDLTICRRGGEPMAAVVGVGASPRYICRHCGDLDLPAHLPPVPPRLAVEINARRLSHPVLTHARTPVRGDIR